MFKCLLSLSKGVSDKLQSKTLDVICGFDRVEDLLATVKTLRNDEKFEEFFNEAVAVCQEYTISGFPIDADSSGSPRKRKIPKRLDENHHTVAILTGKDRFRVQFYFQVCDSLIAVDMQCSTRSAQVNFIFCRLFRNYYANLLSLLCIHHTFLYFRFLISCSKRLYHDIIRQVHWCYVD